MLFHNLQSGLSFGYLAAGREAVAPPLLMLVVRVQVLVWLIALL
jgi:hypothetical protein